MNAFKRRDFNVTLFLLAIILTPLTSHSSTDTPPPPSSATHPTAKKVVTVYLLIDEPAQLQRYVDDLALVSKPNFNRIVFSFVKPTLTKYTPGNLANTGILGFFDEGNGQGVEAFQQLKQAIQLSKEKNIQTFLSVGGWNYSCNFDVARDACGPPPSAENKMHYDYFPDPTNPQEAATANVSYQNLVKLANDLKIDGLDFDYEEFWHADLYAVQWGPSSTADWSTEIARSIIDAGGPTYANLMKYGTQSGSAYVMPKTVDKVDAILHAIVDNKDAGGLLFATAAPPVGARPTTGFVYGDNNPDIYTKGGVWWKGNLKGLWYHLTDKDRAIVDRFDSLGLMTYDLCGDNAQMCAPFGGGPLDLPGQVTAYMKDYKQWLKADQEKLADLSVDNIGKVRFLPAKFKINPKIQFGFEVNQPAYPKNINGQLPLTNALVDTITQQQNSSDGVIIWQLYSTENSSISNPASVRYTINKSCQTFLAGDAKYDCNADFPSAVK
jgi:hypothetical protein